ncbi:MAG: acyl-CoA thioesterase [Gammaproteobacteria bacterium]|jgi:acyl-CoA thioesterase YciA|nr:acyl-CoA thioesterase [Gammaproteobacteria bacterium]MDX2459988.1 acyl-CoA thioesterase [Gammaproteobacteria bacterium]
MPAQELPPQQDAELRTVAMPADTNAYGDIFGGWLLAQMDLAAGSFAIMRARGRVATVGIEAMSFHRPVYVGDQVSCFCRTEAVGNTSIRVHVETWARRRISHAFGESVKVTEGSFTFVALNEDGSKRTLPKEAREG